MLPSTCGLALTYHARLLRLRPAGTLPTTLQPGPIFFLTPRKSGISGVCCEALPQQVNYLIDEGMATSKGSDAVISYLHHFFATHGLGKTDVVPPLLHLLCCRYNASAIYTTSLVNHQRTCLSCNTESKPSWEEVVASVNAAISGQLPGMTVTLRAYKSRLRTLTESHKTEEMASLTARVCRLVILFLKQLNRFLFVDILMHLAIIFAL